MKLLFICSSLDMGGAQRVLSNVLMALPKEWTIHILLNNGENIVFPYQGEIIDLNIKTDGDRTGILYQGKAFFKRLFKVIELKKENKYDYVVSFLESANILNIITKTPGCKSVLTSHASLSLSVKKQKSYRFIVKPLVKILYNRADVIITVSEGVKKDFVENFGIVESKIKTIYNGIQIADIKRAIGQPGDNRRKLAGSKVKICTMGRITEQKGQWHLVRALRRLKEDGYDFELHILGEGKLAKYIEKLAQESGLENNIYFDGFLNPPFKAISECDFFVFPSLWEGFGNVIIEAAACGIPTISSDYDAGAREILAPDTETTVKNVDHVECAQYGILVPVCSGKFKEANEELENEEKLLADAIEMMINNRELYNYYVEKCPELSEKFSMENIGKEWEKLFTGNA